MVSSLGLCWWVSSLWEFGLNVKRRSCRGKPHHLKHLWATKQQAAGFNPNVLLQWILYFPIYRAIIYIIYITHITCTVYDILDVMCIWKTMCIYIYICTYIYMYIYIYTQINIIKSTSKPSRFLQGFIRILKRMIIQWKGPLKGGEWENILRSKDFIWWADEASRILLGSSSPKCFHEKCYTLKGRATKQ